MSKMVSRATRPMIDASFRAAGMSSWHQMPPELRAASEHREDATLYAPRWQCPHRSAFLTWTLALVVPCIAFFRFVAPTVMHEMSPVGVYIGTILVVIANVFMALTSFSDPGTVPRAPSAVQAHVPPPHSAQKVSVNGIHITTKFCHVCGIQRPPRCSHCRETDRCIERWDHYCPWVGNSIGRRNYPFFVCFVFTTMLLASCLGTLSVLHLVLTGQKLRTSPDEALSALGIRAVVESSEVPTALRTMAAAPLSCLLALYSSVVALLLSILGVYHAILIGINQTTYEHVSGKYGTVDSNPFHRGLLLNCGEIWCPCWVQPSAATEVDQSDALERGQHDLVSAMGQEDWLVASTLGTSLVRSELSGRQRRAGHGARCSTALHAVRGGCSSATRAALDDVDKQEFARVDELVQLDGMQRGHPIQTGKNDQTQHEDGMEMAAMPAQADLSRLAGSPAFGERRYSSQAILARLRESAESAERLKEMSECSLSSTQCVPPADEPPPSPTAAPWDMVSDPMQEAIEGESSVSSLPQSHSHASPSQEPSVASGSLSLSSSISQVASRLPPPPPPTSTREHLSTSSSPVSEGEQVNEGIELFLRADSTSDDDVGATG